LHCIVEAAELSPTDVVLEIGCGLGSLTRILAGRSKQVIALEIDEKLLVVARELLGEAGNVRLIHADILDVTPQDLGLPPHYVVTANIPYYVTSPIIRHLLESKPTPARLVLTVQKEVAQRICSKPPRTNLMAVSVQVYGTPRIVAEIPARAFYPPPDVDSAVLRVDCHARALVPPDLAPFFFRVVKAGFGQPRKMLRNTISSGLAIPAGQAEAIMLGSDIDPRRRAETLSIEEWSKLALDLREVLG